MKSVAKLASQLVEEFSALAKVRHLSHGGRPPAFIVELRVELARPCFDLRDELSAEPVQPELESVEVVSQRKHRSTRKHVRRSSSRPVFTGVLATVLEAGVRAHATIAAGGSRADALIAGTGHP
ncbi:MULTISPECIES: hypothetical protein [unclassified Microbacterium]|uniref:hypothetical protein n=1 Tax=unclassified Microbacterium TaxID=2609290 RepID=UPI0030104D71